MPFLCAYFSICWFSSYASVPLLQHYERILWFSFPYDDWIYSPFCYHKKTYFCKHFAINKRNFPFISRINSILDMIYDQWYSNLWSGDCLSGNACRRLRLQDAQRNVYLPRDRREIGKIALRHTTIEGMSTDNISFGLYNKLVNERI